jgi:hypothetical protein
MVHINVEHAANYLIHDINTQNFVAHIVRYILIGHPYLGIVKLVIRNFAYLATGKFFVAKSVILYIENHRLNIVRFVAKKLPVNGLARILFIVQPSVRMSH